MFAPVLMSVLTSFRLFICCVYVEDAVVSCCLAQDQIVRQLETLAAGAQRLQQVVLCPLLQHNIELVKY